MNTKIKFLFIPLLLFSFIIKSYADCSSPTNINAFIGNIPNGTNHYLIINWEAVQNATLYKIEYSQNNINWFELNVSANISYEHNCGDNPNTPYYYRVSASVDGFNFCTPNNCKQFPIYTACDFPQISISNPTGSSLKVNILNETPVANPDYTTYSIYCVTLAKYIQTDGSAGTDEIFLTKEQWQALSFTGLQKETQYCFYAKARNMDGDLRFKLSSSSIYNTESFSTSAKFSTDGSGPTNRFWSPSTCGGSSGIGGLIYNASKGCDGGAIGIEKSWNNYFGCFLRTPYINCSNYDYVTMTLDLTTSARAKDYIRFYYWDVAYKHTVSSIKINGVESLSSFGANGNGFYYTTALTCAKVEVTFDLRNAANKNQILFYIEPECGYNDGQVFKTWIDNVGFVSESIESVCGTTTKECTPPAVSINQTSITLCQGSVLNLTTTASGSPTLKYIWFKDNNEIAGASGSSYVVNNVNYTHQGIYKCNVTNDCGTATSNEAKLTVNSKPEILIQPIGAQLCEGIKSYVFKVSTVRSANNFYQWQKNGVDIDKAQDSTYVINSPTTDNNGIYKCIINNSCGILTTENAVLTMNKEISIITITGTENRCTGDSITLKVIATGTDIKYQWKKDQIEIKDATNNFYYISKLSKTDAGAYSCLLSNNCGSLLANTGNLFVSEGLSLSVSPKNPVKCEDDSLMFKTNVTGEGPYNFQWYKGNQMIADATSATYTIFNISKIDNEYTYTCKASNFCDNKSDFSVLKILTKPVVETKHYTIYKDLGDTISFSVTPQGSEPFSYQWYRNNNPVEGATNSDITIENISFYKDGKYSCVITNNCGSITGEIATLFINAGRLNLLQGYITYDNKQATPINKCQVYLVNSEGFDVDTTNTNSEGYYEFKDIKPGIYNLLLDISMKWGSSNPVDALIVNKTFLGMYSIKNPNQFLAGDVNNDNRINPIDALFITRRFISLINKFPIDDWLYENDPVIITADTKNDIKVICAGDVNSSYPQ